MYINYGSMGSSKPRFVTTAARKLLEEHPAAFGAEFDGNKNKVKEYVESGTGMVNKIAGAITVINKRKAKKTAAK